MRVHLKQGRTMARLLAGGVALAAVFVVQVPAASAQTTSCTGPITGQSIPGDVLVPAGQTCTLSNDRIGGSVIVNGQLQLQAPLTTVGGDLRANPGSVIYARANAVNVGGDTTLQGIGHSIDCNRFQGNLVIKNESLFGVTEPFQGKPSSICGPVGGNVSILNNSAPEIIAIYSINGDLNIQGNSGQVKIVGQVQVAGNGNITHNTTTVFLQNNSFGGDLNCFNNTPPPRGSGNRANGSLNGQCATLG